jgi:hypothetical protein
MSTRTIGRIVGALILLGYVGYLGGSVLVNSATGGTDVLADVAGSGSRVSAGALLMLVNSAAVIAIGVLVFPVLRPQHATSAYAYLVTRVFEGIMLAVGILGLLLLVPLAREYADADAAADASVLRSFARIAQDGSAFAYQVAMIGLAVGSLLFCRALLRAGLVPRFLAIWGLVGYAIFGIGMVLEILGYRVGDVLSVPGGLFEISLAVLLLAKGFPADRGRRHDGVTGPVDAPALVAA